MPASSNFNQAIREAQTSSIVGPNVVQKALPYVGGGMVLTSLGVLAGVSLIATNPALFQPLSIVALAIGTIGIGSVGTAALATGITFVIASYTGQRMSDSVGQALSGVVGLGLIGLLIAMFVQLIGGFFAPGVFGGSGLELIIAGFGTVLFVAMSFVDFYTMPRRYSDDQYLAGALGMYLTYINLFVFILRLMIALQGGGRRD